MNALDARARQLLKYLLDDLDSAYPDQGIQLGRLVDTLRTERRLALEQAKAIITKHGDGIVTNQMLDALIAETT